MTEHQCLQETPLNRSFMHLHLGFDATGLEDLELHHIIVNSWEGGVDTEQVCTCQATNLPDNHLHGLNLPCRHLQRLKVDICALSATSWWGHPTVGRGFAGLLLRWAGWISGQRCEVARCDAAVVQNVVLISIASVMDPSLAPAGKHSLHAYLPATEPFHLWEGGAPLACLTTHHQAGSLMLALGL